MRQTRQTNLSLKEIEKHIGNACSIPYHRCLLINELGYIARFSASESAEAQKLLVELLMGDNENDQWIAIRHMEDLRIAGVATAETMSAIIAFESDRRNAHILPMSGGLILFFSSN